MFFFKVSIWNDKFYLKYSLIISNFFSISEYAPDFGARSIPPATSTQALIGGRAVINCVPNGAPVPTVYWKKLNTTLDVISTDSRFSKNAAGSLEITNIKKSDAGLYKCIATNKLGSDERVGELKVNGKNAIAYCYHFVFKGDAHLFLAVIILYIILVRRIAI